MSRVVAEERLAWLSRTLCVLWFAKFESILRLQRQFRRVCESDPPDDKTISSFLETGSGDTMKPG